MNQVFLYTLSVHGEAKAVAYRTGIHETLSHIASFPGLESSQSGSSEIRLLPVEQHCLWYTLSDEAIVVIEINHSRKNSRNARKT